ncbi:hypothetical protein GOARA_046_00200 [Gordonia araii NBRC 100433]|uniref:Uncharacterized protein n=1 Tax=Gordonia araii NBRC 100433 TaxID=1073574 RepID=G7H1M6_9ACTN|nr:hypothetical protein [Gordonia araii]NNG98278.1 hypothetical protein [Gordonia araii NBRC 100433]GAB09751.1 hypothetical protein GOARA_046_00200 [Gordonia araii NBRC 100433]
MRRLRPCLPRLSAAALAVAATAMLPAVNASAAARPEVGQPCTGAEIGRKVTDKHGRTIICSNYRWQIYTGQRPSHPWADQQRQFFGIAA